LSQGGLRVRLIPRSSAVERWAPTVLGLRERMYLVTDTSCYPSHLNSEPRPFYFDRNDMALCCTVLSVSGSLSVLLPAWRWERMRLQTVLALSIPVFHPARFSGSCPCFPQTPYSIISTSLRILYATGGPIGQVTGTSPGVKLIIMSHRPSQCRGHLKRSTSR